MLVTLIALFELYRNWTLILELVRECCCPSRLPCARKSLAPCAPSLPCLRVPVYMTALCSNLLSRSAPRKLGIRKKAATRTSIKADITDSATKMQGKMFSGRPGAIKAQDGSSRRTSLRDGNQVILTLTLAL